jgi:hypothetical protein
MGISAAEKMRAYRARQRRDEAVLMITVRDRTTFLEMLIHMEVLPFDADDGSATLSAGVQTLLDTLLKNFRGKYQ